MGYEVKKVPFKTVENRVLYLPITDAGTIPAKKDGFTMRVAGFSINKSKIAKHQSEFMWNFSFKTTNKSKISHINIEEIYASDRVKLIAKVTNPQLKNGIWSYHTSPIIANKENLPWIFENRARICLFRISVDMKSDKKVVLHQLVWFSKPTLAHFANIIKKYEADE